MLKTLLLEDDLTLSREVKSFLNSRDIQCDVVYDGNTFARQLKSEEYDAFLLDINVPGMNGLDVCKQIREDGYQNPVIMLTAYGDIEDKKDAYSAGADDFLVKPFHLEELILRINSVLKRGVPEKVQSEVLKVADLEIDLGTKKVFRAQKNIELTKKEFQLLLFLVKAKGRVVSKQTIAEQIWDIHFETSLNTIEVYVNFLRRKIDKGHAIALIHTKPGFGYYLREDK
ncbi:response regulator transcription factor [Jiulongibacter sp. NS-SX5]|uniref:response regulator transcription factor n=1 Tax=Jiulongibacter sp. NS-SX5 TaxID=3463854 RepID=UPI0040592839